ETEIHIQEALRLSPRDTKAYLWIHFIGIAKLQIGADAEAVAWLRKGLDANRNHPPGHLFLAAALALCGELSQARAAALAGLALDPAFTIHRLQISASSDNATYLTKRKRMYEGMRMAGVPER